MCTWFVSESADREATREHHRGCVWSAKKETIIGRKKINQWGDRESATDRTHCKAVTMGSLTLA